MRKKVVLVNVPSSENAYHNLIDFVAVFPPLGLLSIASVLEQEDINVVVLDADAIRMSIDDTVDHVAAMGPDYVGVTGMTATMDLVGSFFSKLKRRFPEVTTLLGGPHVSALPKGTLEEYPDIDIGVIGEGDETVVELMQLMEKGGELDIIPGIVFRKNGAIIETCIRQPIKNLAKLPPISWHLVDFSMYRSYGWNKWVSGHREPLGVVFTGRGCCGRCNFCASHCVFGHGLRFYPLERIKDEIDLLVKKFGIRVLYFQDDTFTVNRKLVNEICDFLIERGYHKKLEIMVSSRVDTIHAPTLKRMREAGVRWICFGVESGNQHILDRMQKNITIEQIRNAFRLSREAGLFIAGNFMVGHLEETWNTAMDTINLACELQQDYVSFAIAIPFPGTDIYKYCLERGITLPAWGKFGSVNSPPIPLNDSLNARQLMDLRRMAVSRFFMRKSYLCGMFMRFNAWAVFVDFARMYLALHRERKEKRF
ncbi:MAG: radical SAM protein [Kiritimatiellae bacterium]|nr:radical SAM protein [Kiritimatiellia bacterium]MDD5522834.1 radical SAM protein [Kiritimatiellia bacterium]